MKNHQKNLSAVTAGRKQTPVQDRARSSQSRLQEPKTAESIPVFCSWSFLPSFCNTWKPTKLDLSESFFNNKASLGFISVSFVLCSVISYYSPRTKLYSHPPLKLFLQTNKLKTSLLHFRCTGKNKFNKRKKKGQLTFILMQYLKTSLSCIRQIKTYTLNFKAEDVPTSDMYMKSVL